MNVPELKGKEWVEVRKFNPRRKKPRVLADYYWGKQGSATSYHEGARHIPLVMASSRRLLEKVLKLNKIKFEWVD